MGVSNLRLVEMILLQAFVVGLIGYGIGIGLAAGFGDLMTQMSKSVPPAFYMAWPIPVLTAAAVLVIIAVSSLVSIRRVLVLEPAIVFRG